MISCNTNLAKVLKQRVNLTKSKRKRKRFRAKGALYIDIDYVFLCSSLHEYIYIIIAVITFPPILLLLSCSPLQKLPLLSCLRNPAPRWEPDMANVSCYPFDRIHCHPIPSHNLYLARRCNGSFHTGFVRW